MSRNRNRSPKQVTQGLTHDGFSNSFAGLGVNSGQDNLISQSGYVPNIITRNRTILENMYRGSTIAAVAVDIIPEDMTKNGIVLKNRDTFEHKETLLEGLTDLKIWDSLNDCLKWARLYGGSVGYILIDGQDPESELDYSTITLGQFKGILPLDKWQVSVQQNELITDLCPQYGLPMYYNIFSNGNSGNSFKVHHSRMLRFTGIDLPYMQKLAENSWGESVIERLWDRLIAYDSVFTAAAQLVYRANIRTLSVEGLRDIMSSNGNALNGLKRMVSEMKQMQANEGISIIDARDKFETLEYNFSGLSDMMDAFVEQIACALQIPLTRLLGQSPAGFSTGDSDIKNYASTILKEQETKLRTPVKTILELLSRSLLDKELPLNSSFSFVSLIEDNNKEKTEIEKIKMDMLFTALDKGIISLDEARTQYNLFNGIENTE